MAKLKKDYIAHFWTKVTKTSTCWLWTDKLDKGYGKFWDGKRCWPAHRFSFETFHGPVKDGLHLDHLCRNRRCVNPWHLEAVTPKENTRRGISPPAKNAQKTQCVHNHEYTVENTIIKKSGQRVCRTCAKKAWTIRNNARHLRCKKEAENKGAYFRPHWSVQTHCKRGHERIKENIKTDKKGRKSCIVCVNFLRRSRSYSETLKCPPKAVKKACIHGHEMTADNIYIVRGKRTMRYCKKCVGARWDLTKKKL